MPVSLRLAVLSTAVLIAGGCSSPDSPEAQVRRIVDRMETAAEERNVGDLMGFVSGDFRDAYGQGPQELSRYVRGYFIANQSIRLLTRINRIDFPLPDEARTRVTIAMVGRKPTRQQPGTWRPICMSSTSCCARKTGSGR